MRFAGIAHVQYDGPPFELGHGVVLTSTYAHLFGMNMMAFGRGKKGEASPGPWRVVRGGFGYDIEVELAVPAGDLMPGGLNDRDTVWLLAALLRIALYAHLMVPVISDTSFAEGATSEQEPLIEPFDIQDRLMHADSEEAGKLSAENLDWVKCVWPGTAELMRSDSRFDLALRAWDACTVRGPNAPALLTMWGALEELFAPGRAELRFRVSAYIASYLETPGPKRLAMFKRISKLYDKRSAAAHAGRDPGVEALVDTFCILRNALVRMIEEGAAPRRDDLEKSLLCGSDLVKST